MTPNYTITVEIYDNKTEWTVQGDENGVPVRLFTATLLSILQAVNKEVDTILNTPDDVLH